MTCFRPYFLTLLYIGVFTLTLKSQVSSLFDHIRSFDSLHLYIETDFRNLLKKNDQYQPARLLLRSGEDLVFDTIGEIRSRGNMRKRVCSMPPTKIRFDKSYLANHQWLDYSTMKVVNACAFNDISETYVELEHLLYKIYNILTEKSFKAQLLNLHYQDTKNKNKTYDLNGFLIEHEDQLAERMQGKVYTVNYFRSDQLNRKAYILFSMFQFMIGNTDWKILNKHNLEVIKVESERSYYPIPYDFDYSGVVQATYAVPQVNLPIKSVTERIYLGPCQTLEEVQEMQTFFINKKEEIMQHIAQGLSSDRHIRACEFYLESFYRIIENDKNARAIFMNCIDY